MAKVTDFNGCFVRIRSKEERIQIEGVMRKSKTRLMMNLKVEDDDIYGKIFFKSEGASKHRSYKEIYFNDGEFFDENGIDTKFGKDCAIGPIGMGKAIDINPVSMAFGIGDNRDRSDVHGSQCISDLKTIGESDLIYIEGSEKVDAELAQIPWTDGSIDEQESSKIEYEDGMRKAMQNIARTCGKSFAVDIGYQDLPALVEKLMHENKNESEWSNGDNCLSSTGHKFTFIGMCEKNGFDCILLSDTGVPTFGFTKELLKPETESEKKTRELTEEVNRICFDLFGTPAFNCNQDIIDTVEKFVINGYKKVD